MEDVAHRLYVKGEGAGRQWIAKEAFLDMTYLLRWNVPSVSHVEVREVEIGSVFAGVVKHEKSLRGNQRMIHLHPGAGGGGSGSSGTWIVGVGAVALDPDGPPLAFFVFSFDVLLGLDSHSSTSTFILN